MISFLLTSRHRSCTASFKSTLGFHKFFWICSLLILGDIWTLDGIANSWLFIFFDLWELDLSLWAIQLTGCFLSTILDCSSLSKFVSFWISIFSLFFCSFRGSGCGNEGTYTTDGEILENLLTFGLFIILNRGALSATLCSGFSFCLVFESDLLFLPLCFEDLPVWFDLFSSISKLISLYKSVELVRKRSEKHMFW